MTNKALTDGFLFGVRVGNSINGNADDIALDTILAKLGELASKAVTLQPTGAELAAKFPGFGDTESLIKLNVSYDQTLAMTIHSQLQLRKSPGAKGNADNQA